MDYILFTQQGEYLGIRGTQPSEEENLIVFEWYEEFVNVTEPTLKDGKIVSGQINYSLEQINQMQFEELSKTDWYYTRFLELNVEIPIEIVNQRKAIREKYDNLKNNIVL